MFGDRVQYRRLMRILVANDDGIYSPGILALAKAAARYGDVRIMAPDVEQSSMGHAITHSRPLTVKRTPIDGFDAVEDESVLGPGLPLAPAGEHVVP